MIWLQRSAVLFIIREAASATAKLHIQVLFSENKHGFATGLTWQRSSPAACRPRWSHQQCSPPLLIPFRLSFGFSYSIHFTKTWAAAMFSSRSTLWSAVEVLIESTHLQHESFPVNTPLKMVRLLKLPRIQAAISSSVKFMFWSCCQHLWY